MKALICTTLALATAAAAAPRALREHIDVHWEYDLQDGWICLARTEAGGADQFDELDDVYLPIDDASESVGGMRYLQPEGSAYEFTGVAPGDPVWIAPQIQQAGQCWPGFNNYQATGVFGSYQESDPRLSEADRSLPLPWIKITLVGVTYQGGGNGAFSLWQEDSSGTPTVWFSTTDHTHPDTYLFEAGSHKHLNWGFGAPGIYRIRMSASAYLGPNRSQPTGESEAFTVTFAVGVFAHWQAENFSPQQLDDVLASGPSADPDRDGLSNLIEYAFGTLPLTGGPAPAAAGLGMPVFSLLADGGTTYQSLSYPRRKREDRLLPEVYGALFAHSPAGPWSDAGVTTVVSGFPAELSALDAEWEWVSSRRPVPPGAAAGFGRVAVGPADDPQ